jgi:hypothetical protein
VTPFEEFCADLDCILDDASEKGVSFVEMVGALTMKAHELSMVSMGMFDADSEDEGEEEV